MIKDARELRNPSFELNKEVSLLTEEIAGLKKQIPTSAQFDDGLKLMESISVELKRANEINEALLKMEINKK